MGTITYITGDATNPIDFNNKIICHICNDIGLWGKGFVLALSKKWKKPENNYRNLSKSYSNIYSNTIKLGLVQFIKVESDIWVANMISQHRIYTVKQQEPPIRYDALEICLDKVADFAIENNASIHCPRIGAGLAGGEWTKIVFLLEKCLCKKGINIYVYDLP